MSTPTHNQTPQTQTRSPHRHHWSRLCQGPLSQAGVLNHGSFGACPDAVINAQAELRDRFEQEPTTFINELWEPLLDQARHDVAQFVGADPKGLVFVRNATEGVNAVINSLKLNPGDELLTNNHEYNACNNTLKQAAEKAGAKVIEAKIPFPLPHSPEHANQAIIDAYLQLTTNRTKLALVSHITSPTAVIFPVRQLQQALAEQSVDLLVDGAHAPGMIDLNINQINAPWYTANCHKWMCAPKGAAFLWTRQDKRHSTRPPITSHGYNTNRSDRSKYQIEFDWTGTHDPSAYLAIPAAIKAMQTMLPNGWDDVRATNKSLALQARDALMHALNITNTPAPDELVGSLISIPLPDRTTAKDTAPGMAVGYADPLQHTLRHQHNLQVPIVPWPAPPKRLIRISAQLYNHISEYQALANILKQHFF